MAPSTKMPKHWADVLHLRPELLSNQGQVTGLQMSLYDAVYRTSDVPYQEADYYSDITEPTPSLVQFLATIAARLGSDRDLKALYHLDQGMGGGKSHALVGAYHLAKDSAALFRTELGKRIRSEAEHIAGSKVDLSGTRVVVLSADNMTPGKANPVYGPATTLHERFLWALVDGEKNKKKYLELRELGSDKSALRTALESVRAPVLILLDELMDYVMQLSDAAHLKSMPGEQAFLNALMDAVDDVPRVAFVIVMIRSEADERGYTKEGSDFRAYVAARLERNGTTVAVSEAQDFAAIIQRRIFERTAEQLPTADVASEYERAASQPWREQVFDRLGAHRGITSLRDRLARTYPFHPDLMTLVQEDWSRHAGFQRVRSTVAIFAATAHYWVQRHRAKKWAPALIGIGDLPVTVVIEDVLSSGLLHGNDKAIQGFRQVAATDISSKDGEQGRAVEVDKQQVAAGVLVGQPSPAVRMATAIFYYSLVPRNQAKRGATRAEVLSAAFEPTRDCEFGGVETVFNALVSEEEGLGALDTQSGSGSSPTRYLLSTHQTLRMFYRSTRSQIQAADRDAVMWKRAQAIASRGLFDEVIAVGRPVKDDEDLGRVFDAVDQNGKNRLVVLDPRRWTLLNGRDTPTRADIERVLGQGENPLSVDNAASCVIVCVNTQRRDIVRKRAHEALAWRAVVGILDQGSDQRREAEGEATEADRKLDEAIRSAYQHYAYLVRAANRTQIEWGRFDDDTKTSLRGEHVWDALEKSGRAVKPHALSAKYLATLLAQMSRTLTLRELSQQFTKNPAFPLVSNPQDISEATYAMLSGPERYEIVSPEGVPYTITSPKDLTMGASDQLLRRHVPVPVAPGNPAVPVGSVGASAAPAAQPKVLTSPTPGTTSSANGGAPPQTTYKRYKLRIPNRSLADDKARDAVWALLSALSDVADPTGPDLQLIDLDVTVTAAQDALESVRKAAESAGARWVEEDDLFA